MTTGSSSSSSTNESLSCSLCLTSINTISSCATCLPCNFSICSSCCTLVSEQAETNTTAKGGASKALLILENPQSICQQADAILLNSRKPAHKTETEDTNSNPTTETMSTDATAAAAAETTSEEDQAALERALSLYHKALSMRHAILGEKHPAVAATHHSIAKAFKGHRHYVASLEAYQAALRSYNNNNKTQHLEDESQAATGSTTQIQNEIHQLMDTMVDAANYYMMQGLELQARHLREDALVQFEYAHSLLASIVALVGSSSRVTIGDSKMNYKELNPIDESFPSELELSLSLCHVTRVIAGVHVSASQYATALPFLQQAYSLLVQVLGKDDQRTVAMASDVVTLQALMKKQHPHSKSVKSSSNNNNSSTSMKDDHDDNDEPQILHWFERDDYDDFDNGNEQKPGTGTMLESNDASSSQTAPLGISIDWIKRGFWREIQAANLDPNATMQDVVDKVIQPKISTSDTSVYLNGIDNGHTGPATVMIVYASTSTVGEIINTLDDYCRSHSFDDKNVHVWLASLCQSPSSSLITSSEHLQALMTNIGHVLAILSPWYDPLVWKTSSCLREIYLAHQISRCKLTLVLPPGSDSCCRGCTNGRSFIACGQLVQSCGCVGSRTLVPRFHSQEPSVSATARNIPSLDSQRSHVSSARAL